MIPWRTYKGRRSLNLAELIATNNISTYEQVVTFFIDLHVEAPQKEEFEDALRAAASTPTKNANGSRKKAASKKASAKSANPEDSPDEVWQDGLDSSYNQKKTPGTRKPRATRKTTTRKSTAKKKS